MSRGRALRRAKAVIPFSSGFAAISTIPLQAVKPRNLGEFINWLKLFSLPALRHVDRTRWLDTCRQGTALGRDPEHGTRTGRSAGSPPARFARARRELLETGRARHPQFEGKADEQRIARLRRHGFGWRQRGAR